MNPRIFPDEWPVTLVASDKSSLTCKSQDAVDFTAPSYDKEADAYARACRLVLRSSDYKAADFNEGGPLYGMSANELLTLVRDGKKT